MLRHFIHGRQMVERVYVLRLLRDRAFEDLARAVIVTGIRRHNAKVVKNIEIGWGGRECLGEDSFRFIVLPCSPKVRAEIVENLGRAWRECDGAPMERFCFLVFFSLSSA